MSSKINKNSGRRNKPHKSASDRKKGAPARKSRPKVMEMRIVSGYSQVPLLDRPALVSKFGSVQKFIDLKMGKETGAESKDEATPQSETPSVAKALFDPLAVYPFKITQTGQFSSSVAGTIFTNTFWNPTGIAEYTSLSTLFSLVRIRRARVHVTAINPHADGYAAGRIAGVLFVSCDYGLSGTNPSSVQNVIDCPNIIVVSLGSTKTHVLDTPNIDNEFAATATPAPGPYAGCYGQFSYGSTGLTVSTLYVQWTLECVYEFTSRT